MSRFVSYLAVLFAFCEQLHPQTTGTIRGTVSLQADQSRLHHATVRIVQLRRSTETAEDGTFEFRDIPPGRYDILAHMHALRDEKQIVEITPGITVEVNFRLALGTVRQEITVTASGREETTIETFQTVTSLDGPQLAARNTAPSLGELLDHETGIAKRSFGPGSSRPVVRGFDGDRVLILQDGVRTGTLSSQSGDHGEPVDGSALERVEVVRGPATLLYGSNAIGGVVNVITRHHEMDNHPHAGLRAHLTGLAGSANGLGGSNGGFEYGFGDYLLWANGGGQRTGDYKSPIGRIENSGSFLTQTSVGIGRHAEKGFFSLAYGLQDGRYGVPPFEIHEEGEDSGEEDHDHEHVKIDWRRQNVRFQGGWRELSGPVESLKTTFNYSDWKHTELEHQAIGTRFFNKQFTYRGVIDQQRTNRLSGSFGLWGMQRAFKAVGEEALAPPVDQTSFALFGLEEVRFERIRLQFGARFEHNSYDPARLRSRSFTGLSGSTGIYVPTWRNGAVVLNYTSSYRAPALEELYNRGPHLGNLTFEVGNPDLERERGHGLELSVRHSSGRARMELTGFYNRLSDFVYLAPTGNEQDGLLEADYAQAHARYMGAEARLDVGVAKDLWLNLGFDAVDAQLRGSRVPLPRIPPVRGRIGLDFRRGTFTIRPELVLSNRQFQIFPTETETAGYAVGNLTATYVIATQHVSHMFGVNAFNLSDRLYRNHLSFIKEFAPEIGRGVRFTYTMNFY
jgi:iron complex outermembrane receptor protein